MRAVAILDVMWDPDKAGRRAPRWFKINPQNHTGRRLYQWLKDKYELLVTNACPQIVNNAQGRGHADSTWLADNLQRLQPIDLLLVCGDTAFHTFDNTGTNIGYADRVLLLPHPAFRGWSKQGIDLVGNLIEHGQSSAKISLRNGRFTASRLKEEEFIPF
jgi:hypothetical protein